MARKNGKSDIKTGDNSVVIGGDVSGSNIVIGNNNTVSNQTVNISALFEEVYKKLDEKKDIKQQDKEDVRLDLQEIQKELNEQSPNESFLARRFRNIKRMAPDIADVALETLKNPIGGVVEIIKKVSKKVADETGA
jgi:hypothetical protein